MKLDKRKTAVISLLLCLAAVVSFGTLAWFQDTDTVDNTLNFVNDFEMDLYETDGNGNKKTGTGGDTIGITYNNLSPGQTIYKDPTVINKSLTASMYVRVTVTVDKTDKWQSCLPANAKLSDIFGGFEDSKWIRYDAPKVDSTAKTVSYTFYLKDALAPNTTATLFTSVTIPSSITASAAKDLSGMKITVKADAIQTTGLETSQTVKAAFETVEGTN